MSNVPEVVITYALKKMVGDLMRKPAYMLTAKEAAKIRKAVGKVQAAWDQANESQELITDVAATVLRIRSGQSSYKFYQVDVNGRKQVSIEHRTRMVSGTEREVRNFLPIGAVKEWMSQFLPKGMVLTVTEGGYARPALPDDAPAMRKAAFRDVVYNWGNSEAYFYVRQVNNSENTYADENLIDPDYLADWENSVATFQRRYIKSLKKAYQNRASTSTTEKVYTPRDVKRAEAAKKAKPDTSQNLLNFLGNRTLEIIADSRAISNMPVAEHGTLSSRRWGIEIEAAGRRGVEAPKGWQEVSDGSLRSAYTGEYEDDDPDVQTTHIEPSDCPEYGDENGSDWSHQEMVTVSLPNGTEIEIDNPYYENPAYCDHCGTVVIDSDHPDWVEPEGSEDTEPGTSQRFRGVWHGRDTGEFVSPILKSFHSRGLEAITSKLIHEPTNYSAGVHVHVEADDLTPKQIGGLVFAYHLLEPMLESSYRRETRTYCNPRNIEQVVSVMKSAKTAKTVLGDWNTPGINQGDRYHTVNLQSLSRHGTIEFRAMGNVYEYEYLLKWASFCREMVNAARAEVPVKVWTNVKSFDDVLAIFQAYGKEQGANIDADYAALTEDERVLVEQ